MLVHEGIIKVIHSSKVLTFGKEQTKNSCGVDGKGRKSYHNKASTLHLTFFSFNFALNILDEVHPNGSPKNDPIEKGNLGSIY